MNLKIIFDRVGLPTLKLQIKNTILWTIKTWTIKTKSLDKLQNQWIYDWVNQCQ